MTLKNFPIIFLTSLFFPAWGVLLDNPSSLPRFVSLRSNAVNLHVGPGKNYPVEWQFVRSGLPVEIVAEFDTWRKIRDWQGTLGWVHKSLLCGKRTAVIKEKQCKLHRKTEDNSQVVAYLEPGVLGKLKECAGNWCSLEVQGHSGWIKRACVWGVYDHEEKFK
jgi:SH3-like domain-containing protein